MAGAPGQVASEETALVARLRGGDERAFEEVVEAFYPANAQTALRMLRELGV